MLFFFPIFLERTYFIVFSPPSFCYESTIQYRICQPYESRNKIYIFIIQISSLENSENGCCSTRSYPILLVENRREKVYDFKIMLSMCLLCSYYLFARLKHINFKNLPNKTFSKWGFSSFLFSAYFVVLFCFHVFDKELANNRLIVGRRTRILINIFLKHDENSQLLLIFIHTAYPTSLENHKSIFIPRINRWTRYDFLLRIA